MGERNVCVFNRKRVREREGAWHHFTSVNSKELRLGLSNYLDTEKHSKHRAPSTTMNDIKLALLGSEGAGKSGEYSFYTLCSLYSLYAYLSFR